MINILILLLTFSGLGLLLLNFIKRSQCHWQILFGESFFVGILIVVIINNLSQFLNINLNQAYFFYSVLSTSTLVLLQKLIRFCKFNPNLISYLNLKQLKPLHITVLLLTLIHLTLVIQQNILLPLTPWDAWSAWIAKAKTWHEFGLGQIIVGQTDWFAVANSRLNQASHYPDGLPLIYLFNSGFLGWNETALNAIYPAMFIAFLFLFYGHLKFFTNNTYAAISLAILTTIPLLNIHVMLAGYADIWVAIFVFTMLIHLQHYILYKECSNLLLAGLFMLLLIMFKLEALIWSLIVIVSALFSVLHKSTRRKIYLLSTTLLTIWYFMGGFQINLPMGELIIAPHLIAIPGLDSIPLIFNNTLPAWFEAMFYSENWNLLWYSLPIIVALLFKIDNKQLVKLPVFFLLISLIFLVILFNMTIASNFASSFTSINRLILHLVPVYIYFIFQVVYQYKGQQKLIESI